MNNLARFDWLSLLLYVVLVTIGLANIYSAVYDADNTQIAYSFMQKQLIAFGLGLGLILMIQLIDTKFFERYASIIYLVSVISLIGLWVFGSEISGARSWYVIGNFNLQPSEFAKVFVALAIAKHLGGFNTQISRFKDYFAAFVIIGIPSLLTLAQPDPGTALVILSLFFVLHTEGLPAFYFYALVCFFVLFILTLLIGVQWVLVCIGLIVVVYLSLLAKRKRKKTAFSTVLIALFFSGLTYSISYIF